MRIRQTEPEKVPGFNVFWRTRTSHYLKMRNRQPRYLPSGTNYKNTGTAQTRK